MIQSPIETMTLDGDQIRKQEYPTDLPPRIIECVLDGCHRLANEMHYGPYVVLVSPTIETIIHGPYSMAMSGPYGLKSIHDRILEIEGVDAVCVDDRLGRNNDHVLVMRKVRPR